MATHYFEGIDGGIQSVACALARALAKRSAMSVTWAAAGGLPALTDEDTERVLLPSWDWIHRRFGLPMPIPRLGALRALWQRLATVDLLLIHDCLYFSNIAAFVMAKCRRRPVVVVQHIASVPYSNPVIRGVMALGNALATRTMLRLAEQVVFISATTERHFSALQYRKPPILIFNGVDTEVFRPLPETADRDALRRDLGLPADRPIALFVGRFVEKKGLPLLAEMARRRPDIAWVFAGSGPDDPRQWNLPNVHVLPDRQGATLAPVYQAADLLVLPSYGEGYPLVIQEALAVGLNVLCSDDVATADSAATALLNHRPVDPADMTAPIADWLTAVDEAMTERHGASDRSSALAAFARRQYSWQEAAERYATMLEDVAARRPSTRVVRAGSHA